MPWFRSGGRIQWRVYFFAAALVVLCGLRISSLAVGTGGTPPVTKQDGRYDYEGVIHWHTSYTGDATGSYEKVAEVANRQHVHWMIATERNNFNAFLDKKEGWYGDTLLLSGVESTRPEGYLLGLNLQHYTLGRKDATDAVLSDLVGQGGIVFIAHPKNPRWRWKGRIDPRISGEEILDLSDEWYTVPAVDLLVGLLYYPFNTRAAYLEVFQRPVQTLKAWDDITKDRAFVGIYAPDFHQAVELGSYKVPFPKVAEVLPVAHDHVLLHVPFSGKLSQDKAMLYEAIRDGHVYVALDMVQDATGFFFGAKQGDRSVWMGGQLPAGRRTEFAVKVPGGGTPENVAIHVYWNGEQVTQASGREYQFEASEPGAYRIEVTADVPTFWGIDRNLVWIYSNPIYLR